jgi:RNA polymerase sigma-70 factor (sigma-E family)
MPPAVEAPVASFSTFYASTYDSMVRLAYVIIGSPEVAEEVAQESYVGVYRRWSTLEEPERYLRRSIVNGCRDRLRRNGRWQVRQPLLVVDAATEQQLAGVTRGERTDLVEALRRLPVRQRSAIVLKYFGDLSEAEIADALGVRPGTVKSLLHRGLEVLRKELEP